MNPLIHFSLLFDINIVICYKIVEIFWQILNISRYLLDYQISYTIQATTMYKTLTKQYNSYIFSDKITRLNRFSCALIINGVDKKIVDLATVEKPNKSCQYSRSTEITFLWFLSSNKTCILYTKDAQQIFVNSSQNFGSKY